MKRSFLKVCQELCGEGGGVTRTSIGLRSAIEGTHCSALRIQRAEADRAEISQRDESLHRPDCKKDARLRLGFWTMPEPSPDLAPPGSGSGLRTDHVDCLPYSTLSALRNGATATCPRISVHLLHPALHASASRQHLSNRLGMFLTCTWIPSNRRIQAP
jgi:hypothetical protein